MKRTRECYCKHEQQNKWLEVLQMFLCKNNWLLESTNQMGSIPLEKEGRWLRKLESMGVTSRRDPLHLSLSL